MFNILILFGNICNMRMKKNIIPLVRLNGDEDEEFFYTIYKDIKRDH
jgi:hypothetical protein